MTHTPGPWKVAQRQVGYYGRNVIAPHGKNWSRVCAIDYPKTARWHREGVANAHLISAAPDLLDAILNSDNAHWTPAMRAAIAKALNAEEIGGRFVPKQEEGK